MQVEAYFTRFESQVHCCILMCPFTASPNRKSRVLQPKAPYSGVVEDAPKSVMGGVTIMME